MPHPRKPNDKPHDHARIKTIATIELLADGDGTYGARWTDQFSAAVTWDHPSIESVLEEVHTLLTDSKSARR